MATQRRRISRPCGRSLATFTLTLTKVPYRTVEDQLLATSAQLMLLTIFAGAGYIKAFEDTRTAGGALGDPALAQRIYGFASTDQIALLLLAFAATTLLLLLVLLALMLYREGSLETIRVRATNLPPEVTLRSCMASRSADWVLGVARLISSARTTLAKTGPRCSSKEPSFWWYTRPPVTSDGRRSGVNWMRL